jgi:glutathione S-transferase
MPITMYDLAAADTAIRFSPYCWRTRFALAHKGLQAQTEAWHFIQKDRIAFSGQDRVPVIVDDGTVVHDSWGIALYLERAYADRPSLFGPSGAAHALFINAWADTTLQPGIARLIVADIWRVQRPEDQPYFRESREKAFGQKLEDVVAGREQRVAEFRRVTLLPLRTVLRRQNWLGGDAPDYADYIVLGSLQWPRCISRFALLEEGDPVQDWFARGLALFGGLGAAAPTV